MNPRKGRQDQLLKEHLNRKSYRTLEDEYGISAKTICSFTNAVTKTLINSNELTGFMKPRAYSGIMLVDGKYVPVKYPDKETPEGSVPKSKKRRGKTKKGLVILPFMDYLTHDIPVYTLAGSENMFEIAEGFRKLKEIGYPLKVLICDESMGEIAKVAREFYPEVIIQLCLTHYSRNIDREFKINIIKRKIKSLEKKLQKLDNSFLIETRPAVRKKALSLINRIAELEHEYDPLIKIQSMFQEIFWKVSDERGLMEMEDTLNAFISQIDLTTYRHFRKIIRRYRDYYRKRDELTAFARYPELKIPKTTNLIEGFNSTTLEIRFTSIRGFEREETAKYYINALILKYRFHPFKCCKKPFMHLNGKSPLEISRPLHDFNPRSRDWVELCRELKSINT